MQEVVRKLFLVANWGFFGGIGLIALIISITGGFVIVIFLYGFGSFVIGAIAHKIINWIFD